MASFNPNSFSSITGIGGAKFVDDRLSGSNWFERTFDPSAVEMRFNSAQAEAQRQFSSAEAKKNRD